MQGSFLADILYVLIYGVIFASLYGIMTVGFSFICGLGGFYDIALPAYFMVAAFLFVRLAGPLQEWSLPLVVLLMGFLCLAHYLVFIRRIREDAFTVFFASLLLALVIQGLMSHFFSAGYTHRIEPLFPGNFELLGVIIRIQLLIGGAIGWAALFLLKIVTSKTNIGRAIVAIPQSARGSQVIGLDVTKIQGIVYFIGGALLAFGAYFYGSYLGVSVQMWVYPLIIMFTITVVGGLGSINGIIWATLLIGFMEVFVVTYIDPRLRAFVILALAITILIYKPKGFAGIRIG